MDPADVVPLHAVLHRYPGLAGLVAIVNSGWRFREITDERGVDALCGFRHYPDGITDAITIRGEGDAAGLRGRPAANEVIQEPEGTLAYVIDRMLSLPTYDSGVWPGLVVATSLPPWMK
jgi:hypothetical protein